MFTSKILNSWGIKKKLIISYILIVTIPVSILGSISYNKAKDALYFEIKTKLDKGVETYKTSLERNIQIADEDTKNAKLLARKIVEDMANILITYFENTDKNSSLERIKNQIASIQVGKTGYVFILDYKGNYVVSKDRKSDGESVIDSKDSKGNFFVQDILKKGMALSESGIDFHEYPWKLASEKEPREKITALVHIKSLQWIIGVSAYYSDLVNSDLRNQTLERFATSLKSEKVGKTGYMFVMDLDGKLIYHPSNEGKNISNYSFAQRMLSMKEGFIDYEWEGLNKVMSFTYLPDLNWIIASGSYLSDFSDSIISIRNSTMTILIISLITAFVFAFLLSSNIVNPILKIIATLKGSSDQVSASSSELSLSSQELASASSQQAASLEETSSSLEEISGMVGKNVQNAKECYNLCNKVNTKLNSGVTTMTDLSSSMKDILESNNAIANLVRVISEIGQKTEIIDEIVFQTKLLSFNASVEAERAGDHGRGFAVVAQEVGNLAQMSGNAATEISSIVSKSISEAENITNNNRIKVENGHDFVKKSSQILNEISDDTKRVITGVESILGASEEQLKGIQQINTAVSQLDHTTQENSATSEEAASASEELNAQAKNLNDMVLFLTDIVIGTTKENSLKGQPHTQKNRTPIQKRTVRIAPG